MAQITEPITNKTWVQVVDQAQTMRVDGTRELVLQFKGETQLVADAAAQIYPDMTLSACNQLLQTTFTSVDDGGMNIDWWYKIDGGHSTEASWWLTGYDVRQLEAGQYSVIKIIFTNSRTASSGDPSGEEPYAKVLEDTASVQWQSYSVSPYIYCNETAHGDIPINSEGQPEQSEQSGNPSASIRRHIEMAYTQNAQNSDNNQYRWQDENQTWELTQAEKLIMNKVAAGVNPVFHYPIVQHTRVVETNLSSIPKLPADCEDGVDVMSPLPSSVLPYVDEPLKPWTMLAGQFVYCGQNTTVTVRSVKDASGSDVNIYTYTCVDTFEGALKPDHNFYGLPDGNQRWEFHVGPVISAD